VRPFAAILAAFAAALSSSVAEAGGLDLPILYTARHAGMGGTAIASVGDPSAVLHNPAGLSGVGSFSVLNGVTLVLTNLETNPAYPDQNVQTGNSLAPAPLLAAAYHPWKALAFGLGAYPMGAVSGTFRYDDANGVPTYNAQNTIAFEISPAVSFTPIEGLSFGAGYRITYVQFDRHLGPAANPVLVDIDSAGANFTGFRVGAQWRPVRWLALGAVFRPEISIKTEADHGHLLGLAATHLGATMNFPAKVGAGARADFGPVSIALDYELVFNSQFKTIHLSGDLPGQAPIGADFVFNWSDSSTVKVGAEYRVTPAFALRAGYAWDGVYSNPHYPDTFAQPSAPGNYLTAGAGYRGSSWSISLALAFRPDEATRISQQEIASQAECRFCTYAGTYASRLDMALLDFSKDFDLGPTQQGNEK
jgi:long-chain fatty acid transport protein